MISSFYFTIHSHPHCFHDLFAHVTRAGRRRIRLLHGQSSGSRSATDLGHVFTMTHLVVMATPQSRGSNPFRVQELGTPLFLVVNAAERLAEHELVSTGLDAAGRQSEHHLWAVGFFRATAQLAIDKGAAEPPPEWGAPVVA